MSLFRFPALFVGAALALLLPLHTLRAADSLIPNGDMEKANKAGDFADHWGAGAKGISYENENGNHFLRIQATEPDQMTMIYQIYKIPADAKALELTWRQRITNLKPGKQNYFDARILLDIKDAKHQKLKSPGAPYTRKDTGGWVQRTLAFLVPEGASTLDFMPSLFKVERGTFDIDDVVLKPADPVALQKKAEAKKVEDEKSRVPVEEPNTAKFPQPLHVAGNKILRKDGTEIFLQGVNVVSLEWSATGEQIMKSTLVAIEDWKSNFIRLPVKETYWFGKEGPSDGGQTYKKLVDDIITLAANRGAYVLLDLHRFKAPKAEHVEFWKDAAARYKDHPAVVFDLFNEPHGTSWEVWRNGGFIEEKKAKGDEDAFTTDAEKAAAKKGFQAVGMQALYNAVRETGAKNVVAVGGLDYAYDLSGIMKGFALDGENIALSSHIYPWKKGWQSKVLDAAVKYPIIVGECGANNTKMSFIPASGQEDAKTWVPAFLGLVQQYHLHWTAFCLHPKSAPHLIDDWTYTPNAEWGDPAKRALAGEKFPPPDHLR